MDVIFPISGRDTRQRTDLPRHAHRQLGRGGAACRNYQGQAFALRRTAGTLSRRVCWVFTFRPFRARSRTMRAPLAALVLFALSGYAAAADGNVQAQAPAVRRGAGDRARTGRRPAAIRKVDAASFVRQVMAMNEREIGTARKALDRASDDAVKAFAPTHDHGPRDDGPAPRRTGGRRHPRPRHHERGRCPHGCRAGRTPGDLDKAQGADFDRLFWRRRQPPTPTRSACSPPTPRPVTTRR